MLKPSIKDTVTLIADHLRARETDIRDLGNESTTAIRLFAWHLLTMLGHSDEAIAKNFQTTPGTIRDGITEWRRIIQERKHEPEVTQRILAELNNPIPATTH